MKKMQSFQIEPKELTADYGKFVIEPLEQGYGHTLGTALRRVLLTGLSGAAVTQIRISGLKHQFSAIKGVKEDGIDLILNIKKIRVSYGGDKPAKLTLSAKGRGEVKAGDIKAQAGVVIANPDLVIATLADDKAKLDMELQIESGVGYSVAEDRKTNTIGLIPLDADFSPVRRVSYKVEETRVGRLTNYDKLTLEIWSDGSTSADEALKNAAQILIGYLGAVVNPVEKAASAAEPIRIAKPESKINRLSVEELNLPTRIANALIGAGYETVEDILGAGKSELSRVRNLGEKSTKVIEAALGEKGVVWEG
ncbi:MAG: DNA-directed RNA polymerase subunit alpha [Candidatus Blackburnbacteria bacterium RIFCSPHIGHO2_01_FULL_43_15b]|uniref:DNA-directed RNA polymerase subunit alpha n=1 Tax=Candidatus Blackburnbacteria bacterium RIFCSPHIGHO2_01_FULL_43_15b TaxID=1797513 RepID=A0A1G1UZ14_9BACT|nr:MAG: DNA-directed RNA polymerase subunit alpha [Candidatus Blackburnbacteria bacterium RIFCSPHIGHO2_01_FULL_43_15b]